MNTLTGKRIVAYCRISNDAQEGGSENQEKAIERWAQKEGLTIRQWYKDNEGRNPRGDAQDRPQFQKMIADARAGFFDVIVVHYLKRLGLLGLKVFRYLDELNEHKVIVWSVQGNRSLSSGGPEDLLKMAQDTASSYDELQTNGDKFLNQKITAALEGRWSGGLIPFGLDVVCYGPDAQEKWRCVFYKRHRKGQEGHREKVYPDGRREQYRGKNNVPHKDKNDTLRLAPPFLKNE